MNGEARKQVVVAIVSLAVGAAFASVLGNSQAREKLLERSKKLFENFRSKA